MTKPIPGIKIPYFIAQQYPETDELRCVEILIPDDDAFMPLLGGLVKLAGRSFNYKGATAAHRFKLAEMWRVAYDETDWEQCMNCEQLIECLQPLFDTLNEKIDSQAEQITQLQQAVNAGSAAQKALPPTVETNATYAGALAVVQYMDRKNRAIYKEAEDSFVDNAAEMTDAILGSVPNITTVEVSAGADLANQYFNNQVLDYIDQYPAFEQPAACNLYCFIVANDGQMDIDVWGDWLDGLDALLPESDPARLYAKYSPLRQTFLNQVAAFLNGEQSLQSYFDEILQAYYTGTTTPVPLPEDCDCPECDSDYTSDPEATGDPLRINPAPEALLEVIGEPGVFAYGRRITVTFATPRVEADIPFDWVGTHDQVRAQLGDGDYVFNATDQNGTLHVEADTPSDTIVIDTGYSGTPGAFEDRYAAIYEIIGCT